MDVLLMAAGFGSRLKERTKDLPKALLPVGEKLLLDYTLEQFSLLPGVERFVVVTGFQRDKVVQHLDSVQINVPIIEAYNPDYQKGNFYSLLKGLEHIGESFAVTNVDHIFPRDLLQHCQKSFVGVSAICDFDRPLLDDCMKVKLVQDDKGGNRVQNIDKKLTEFDAGYIGMTWVQAASKALYLNSVDEVLKLGNEKAHCEMVLASLARGETPPHIVDASGFGWLEVDDEGDLQRALETLKAHPKFLHHGHSTNVA